MTQRKIRCTVVAAAFAAVLALAAPAQAASQPRTVPASGWLEAVWQWVGGMWWGGGAASTSTPTHHQKAAQGSVISPGSDPSATTQTTPSSDKGYGIDPNG